MSQAFCHACYGTSLTFENGVLVCDACGTQTQVFQEETEFQQGIDDVRGRRRAAGAAGASQQPSQAAMIAQQEQQAAQQLKDAALLYARCLQHLLKVQGEALVNKFGCSSELPGLLRQLWLSHIPSTGILEPQPHRALRNRTALGTAAAAAAAAAAGGGSQHLGQQGGDVSDEDGSSDGEQQQQQQQQQHGVRALSGLRAAQLVEPHNMKQLLWKLLHPQATLQLCFLGCVLLREAVTLFELLRWALDGQLPFLELPHCSMQVATGGVLSILPVRCLQPQLQLDPLAFCNSCCQLAAQLGLALPQPPGEALLLRTIKELGLPQVVYETALQLYCLYLIDTPEMQVAPILRRSKALPYAWLSAALLIALKLLYGLGSTAAAAAAGQLPLLQPKAPGPPAGWLVWAQQAMQQLPGISGLPLSEEQVLQLDPAEMRQYIQFCRQYMFAGQPVVSSMEDVQRLFDGWYDAADLTEGRQQQQQILQEQQQPAADTPSDRLQPSQQQAAGPAATPHPHTAAQQQQPPQQPGQQQSNPQLGGPGSISSTSSICSNYSLTVLGQGAGSSNARLSPELAAVTCVLAGYAHASPATLVGCVRRLEKQMLAVESALKVMDQLKGNAGAGEGAAG